MVYNCENRHFWKTKVQPKQKCSRKVVKKDLETSTGQYQVILLMQQFNMKPQPGGRVAPPPL